MAQGEASRISKLVRAFVNQLQEVEDAAHDVLLRRSLGVAYGQQLDNIGEIVGEERLGRSDADYRDAIIFKTFLNSSNGEPETLISALRVLTQSPYIYCEELYPAKVHLTFDGTVLPTDLHDTMQELCPAGVDLVLVHSPASGMLILDDVSGSGSLTDDNSLSNVSQATGGQLSEIIE